VSGDDCTGGVCPQPITLGELIALLEGRPAEQQVSLGFGEMVPGCCDSYRGFYDHLAVDYYEPGYDHDDAKSTVGYFLETLRKAKVTPFYGYKGGVYRMTDATPVWVAKHGRAGGTAIVGLARCEHRTVLQTAYCDAWSGATESAIRSLFGPNQ
jgi:hypothetical protein